MWKAVRVVEDYIWTKQSSVIELMKRGTQSSRPYHDNFLQILSTWKPHTKLNWVHLHHFPNETKKRGQCVRYGNVEQLKMPQTLRKEIVIKSNVLLEHNKQNKMHNWFYDNKHYSTRTLPFEHHSLHQIWTTLLYECYFCNSILQRKRELLAWRSSLLFTKRRHSVHRTRALHGDPSDNACISWRTTYGSRM